MRKSIMICDDEEGIREAIKLVLEKDFDVVLAENGDDAVSKMKQSPTDMIILDIKMPRMDGLQVLRRVKKVSPSLKVLIATGYRSVETAEAAAKLGATEYIIKPFERKDMLETVKRILGLETTVSF